MRLSAAARSPVRSMTSLLKRSISSAAILRKLASRAIAGFELLAVDQQCSGPGDRLVVLVEVAEQFEFTVDDMSSAVLAFLQIAGDVVVDQLRGSRVVAYDDEARRHLDAFLAPQLVGLGVVPVKRLQRGLQLDRQVLRIQGLGLAAPFLRHLGADVLPQVAELGHFLVGQVVGHGHPWAA